MHYNQSKGLIPVYKLNYKIPQLFLAIHNGHNMSENIKQKIGISELDRMREEDPYTEFFINDKENFIIQNTSRFEYDLNRMPDKAIYRIPENCWGLPIYPREQLTNDEVIISQSNYDTFYTNLINIIDNFLECFDKIIVWDIHSYNHRRNGDGAIFDPDEQNPEIILGTNNYKYMSRDWEPLVNKIEELFKSHTFKGDFVNRALKQDYLDVRQNVKFPGGYLSQFLNKKYADRVCCVAVEFKKIWMNEWTQEIDEECFSLLKKIFNDVCGEVGYHL